MIEFPVDTKYYEAVNPKSIAEWLLITARHRIYHDFMYICRPKQTDTVLDVGVSDVINDGANMFERLYPHAGNVTAAGLGQGAAFRATFPKVSYVRI